MLTNDVSAILQVTGRTLMTVWQGSAQIVVPAPNASEHKAAGLLDLIQALSIDMRDLGLQAAVEQATRYARARLEARDPARQVIVHGDPHAENLLKVEHPRRGAETGFVFVDPEGFRCEPEYDLGVALRGWNSILCESTNPSLILRKWCEQLARITSTNADAIWQWAYLERVSTGLYLRHHGLTELSGPFLVTACKLLGSSSL